MRPDVPDDFAKYGISIMVSFRSDEQLQELTAWQQSGGKFFYLSLALILCLQVLREIQFKKAKKVFQL